MQPGVVPPPPVPQPHAPRVQQIVDPAISRSKFNEQVSRFRELEAVQRSRGILMLEATFPRVLLAFAAPGAMQPTPIVFAVELDFTNYDLEPPSVKFVDPFTGVPLRIDQLGVQFIRQGQPIEIATPQGRQMLMPEPYPLVRFMQPNGLPFLCLPGVREYHNHPAHSGDSWLRHRKTGEGTLSFLVDQLHKYGISPIKGYTLNINIGTPAIGIQAGPFPA
jgi:hypothetical protein